ncbi:MAG TPA: hypothetical protein PKD53_14220 [Chloroflexaceae bacterium]|nr:hypothetical protein [Chloroflexaceae bacterium]
MSDPPAEARRRAARNALALSPLLVALALALAGLAWPALALAGAWLVGWSAYGLVEPLLR